MDVFYLLNNYTCVLVVCAHVSTCNYMYLGPPPRIHDRGKLGRPGKLFPCPQTIIQ